ncbi:uncharacterized protein BDR25DRAFT_275066 [Lindgomyces ingoldianus]|uniref:Uncharacterized protein n=1 Tax=Lindgomyces ingoldianus TaxID=673940 RepID=A0ACB6RG61_9PLEO|nr:uncharacterized protein BDR25DRAFT_275066 [Lindgomyces ingoldianus]KAF2477715.1 hypothetical protein BDR25DRAFT_275066 [Lindgomyces ingoldianus]
MEIDSVPRITLPGFGLPVNTLTQWSREGENTRFPHAIADWFSSDGVSVRERRMLEFMTQITDKPEWTRKVFDEAIIAKWKEEAIRWDDSLPENGDWWLSETMFECCMLELREKAEVYQKEGFVAVLDAEATIVKSDIAVSGELRDRLRGAVKKLENVPDRVKDWHPGSDEKVLDLVHPSLFPVVYGFTRALPFGTVPLESCAEYTGKGEVIDKFEATDHVRKVSWGDKEIIDQAWGSYQWLPSNITFTDDGTAKIVSYINNLHPREHTELYKILEAFVDASIPLWNECLSWFHNRIRISIGGTSNEDYKFAPGVKFDREPYKHDAEEGHESDSEDEEDDESWAWEHGCIDQYRDWRDQNRILEQREPAFTPHDEHQTQPGAKRIDLRKDFTERGLQVIFKLANIHLTPEKPEYEGGSWHVEGSLNEHICATAIYYYDCENVTDSRLAFRQSYDAEAMIMRPAQSEYSSTEAYFGITQNGSSILNLGSVLTPQNRLLAFPNVLQHQVQPFSLVDKTKSGHRKILAMFLVDPHIEVLSTANVPPQRKDWWAQEVRKIGFFARLPKEIFDMIVGEVREFPLGWKEAVQVREMLMAERGKVGDVLEKGMDENTFFFCEH